MKTICFNYLYKKLLNEHNDAVGTATLLAASTVRIEQCPKVLLDYDTEGVYSLGKTGTAILLLFLKEAEGDYCCATNLFTTIRNYSLDKYRDYLDAVGEVFKVKIKKGKQ